MKIEEVRSKTEAELDFELGKYKQELFDLRFKGATETVAVPSRIKLLRRAIARILTVKHERHRGIRNAEAR